MAVFKFFCLRQKWSFYNRISEESIFYLNEACVSW